MKLNDEEIKKYSEIFKQPVEVVKAIASMYDDLKEFQKNLYELDEGYIPEDIDSKIKEKLSEVLPLIKEKLSNETGIDSENIDGSLSIMKVNPNLFQHICPFIKEEQKNNIDCKFCPLQPDNFIQIITEMANLHNISLEQAAEQIKFNVYHFTDDTYKKIINDMNNYYGTLN